MAKVYQGWFMEMSRTVNLFDEENWTQLLEDSGFYVEYTRRYFSPSALRALEWGHYFGAPCLLAKRLSGRWILLPSTWNLWLTARLVRRYYDEACLENGTYSFFLARKKGR